MRNIFKKAILPLLVFGIAIAGVFATNSSVVLDQPSQPLHTGSFYYKDIMDNCSQAILDAEIMDCTLVNTAVFCTWEESPGVIFNLFAKKEDLLICSTPLYKRTIP